ncbi:MAG: helix-turn-helix transcriptional regulator [Treponema sp.]|jgi:transcriptional regulator with XRE-family HTH domain|nr:helix-turn-helix transcriptional regulator [Treponema sp.]
MLFLVIMSDFSERLRSEIDYAGLSQKELAARAGIKKRALDMYLGAQKSMPPADIAVKIALALGVSVEYLITGTEARHTVNIAGYIKLRDVLDDLLILPEELFLPIKAMIRTAANLEREKKEALLASR